MKSDQPVAGEQEDSGIAGFVRAALSPSGLAWQEWFERMGNKATVDVVNATANLVCAEREIHSRTSVSPSEEEIARELFKALAYIDSDIDKYLEPHEACRGTGKVYIIGGEHVGEDYCDCGNGKVLDEERMEADRVKAVIAALRSARASQPAVPVDDELVKAIEARCDAVSKGPMISQPTQDIRYLLSLLAARPDVQELAAQAVEHMQKAWYSKDEDKQIADGLLEAAVRLRENLITPRPDVWEQAIAIVLSSAVHLEDCDIGTNCNDPGHEHVCDCGVSRIREVVSALEAARDAQEGGR